MADQQSTIHPDTLTIIAITIVAAACTDVLHELVGHGAGCLISGGKPLIFSTVHFECSVQTRLLSAGGTIINLVAGLISLFAARRRRSVHWRLFFWLSMVFNFLDAAGYFLYSGIGKIGDWAYVIHDLHPAWAWRVGLTVLGAITYWWFVMISLRELQPLLSPDQEKRLRLARRFLFIPYFTNGVLLTVSGLFNPVGMFLVAISAMAASFGGCSGLLWMGSFLRGNSIPPPVTESAPLTRSWQWIGAAVPVAIVFIFIIGRGVKL
jgi:hypothetical protein